MIGTKEPASDLVGSKVFPLGQGWEPDRSMIGEVLEASGGLVWVRWTYSDGGTGLGQHSPRHLFPITPPPLPNN